MKALALLFALLVVSYAHDGDDDNDYNTLCESGYPNPFGDGYFYLGDMASNQGYLTALDNSTGRYYYWSLCGYEDNEDLEEICGDDNAVCYQPTGGDMNVQAFIPVGSFEALSAEAIETNETVLLLLTYGNGAPCGDGSAETSFLLICDENATTPVVDNFEYSADGCDALLTVRTSAACARDELPSGCWAKKGKWLHIAFWSLVGVFSVCCCCACCAAIKRRRCRSRAQCHMKNNYTELDVQVQKPVPAPAPQPIAQSQNGVPQLINVGGQYYMNVNGIQYPVQLVPAPQYAQYMQQQPAEPTAVAPLIPIEEEVVDLQNSQIQEDEKLARQLQAQFNQ